jgi:DNA repair exonuclease SbcCD ATPase subunit
MASTLKSIEQRFLQRQTEHAMRAGQKAQLDLQIVQVRSEKAQALARQKLYSQVQALLLAASAAAREAVRSRITDLVTLALTAITGDPYRFKMDIVQHAGIWSVTFKVVNPAGVELDPLESCGGGIADICSMALRIAILEMYEPRVEGPILLDENMKFLSRDHIRTAGEFFHMICQKTKRQVLLVTHVPELAAAAERCFEIQPSGSTSTITDVT